MARNTAADSARDLAEHMAAPEDVEEEEHPPNPYIDHNGTHWGACNGCGEEVELGQDCDACDGGEVEPYDDDPDPDA